MKSPNDAHLVISDGSGENCDSTSASAIDSTGLSQGLSYASQSLGGYSSRIDRVADDNQSLKSPNNAHLVISDGSGENCDSTSASFLRVYHMHRNRSEVIHLELIEWLIAHDRESQQIENFTGMLFHVEP